MNAAVSRITFRPGCPPLDRLRFVKSPATLALALSTFALTATAAHGHASLQRAEPGIESKLKRSPTQVKLYFTERVEPGYSSVRVVNEHDQQVDRRDSNVDPSNRSLLRVTLPPLSSRNVPGAVAGALDRRRHHRGPLHLPH